MFKGVADAEYDVGVTVRRPIEIGSKLGDQVKRSGTEMHCILKSLLFHGPRTVVSPEDWFQGGQNKSV